MRSWRRFVATAALVAGLAIPRAGAAAGASAAGYVDAGRTGGSLTAAVGLCGSGAGMVRITAAIATSSLTVPLHCTLWFQGGGEILVAGGQTLTIEGAIQAPETQRIFGGAGAVSLGGGGTVYAEWFGAVGDGSPKKGGSGTDNTAAFAATIAACSSGCTIRLRQKAYLVSGTVIIPYSSVSLVGADTQGVGGATSCLMSTSASADILDIHSGTGFIQWNRLRDFCLERVVTPVGTARGLSVDGVGGYDIDHVTAQDSITNFYFHNAPNYAVGSIRDVNATWGASEVAGDSYTKGTALIGFELDSEDGTAENSILFNTTNVAQKIPTPGVTEKAYYIHGKAINDVDFENAFSDRTTYGAYIHYSGGGIDASSGDVIFTQSTFDNFGVAGIHVDGVTEATRGAINFNGGYVLNLPGAGRGTCAIEVEGSVGVDVNHYEIGNGNGNGICVSGSSSFKAVGNTLHAIGQTGVAFTNTKSSVVTANTIQGAAATGMSFDAASTGNQVQLNAIDPLVKMPIADLSGSNYNTLAAGSSCPAGSPTITASMEGPNGGGLGGTVASIGGYPDSNCLFGIYFTAGSGSVAGGVVARVHFGSAFPIQPVCFVEAKNGDAASVRVWVDQNTTDAFLELGATQALVAGKSYAWVVSCRTQ